MAIHHDPALEHSLGAIAVPSMRIGHRLISLGDEHALMREEAKPLAASVLKVRRASGAARIVARELLATIGCGGIAIPKHASGAPIWPRGIVGSLAHDNRVAIAALALGCDFCALGIDIEPAETLPAEVTDLVATPRERQMVRADPYLGRLLFVAKEAVYKALYPLDHTFLDHQDIEIDFAIRKARTRTGRIVDFRFCVSTHFVAIAFLSA
jgi:4'-phosphopantetheinyl transferase EntD